MPQAPISISSIAARAPGITVPSPSGAVFQTVSCPLLPNLDGTGYGRDVKLKRLNFKEQLNLLGRVSDGVAADAKSRQEGDPDAPASDDESQHFWESCYLLILGCVDPVWTLEEVIRWTTQDEVDGINCADVVGWLLHHIRGWNDEARGLEDISAGLQTLSKMPRALQKLEAAYLAGGNALELLLEGKESTSQEEMAAFIEKWGDIIAELVLRSVRKRAKIEAEENATAITARIIDAMVQMGYLQREGHDES